MWLAQELSCINSHATMAGESTKTKENVHYEQGNVYLCISFQSQKLHCKRENIVCMHSHDKLVYLLHTNTRIISLWHEQLMVSPVIGTYKLSIPNYFKKCR